MKTFMPRSIAYNYPGFQELPKGIRRMLLVSETHFFAEDKGHRPPRALPLPMFFPAPVAPDGFRVSVAWQQ